MFSLGNCLEMSDLKFTNAIRTGAGRAELIKKLSGARIGGYVIAIVWGLNGIYGWFQRARDLDHDQWIYLVFAVLGLVVAFNADTKIKIIKSSLPQP